MIGPILRRSEAGRLPTRREIMLMLGAQGTEYHALLESAHRLSLHHKGEEPALRGLISIADDLQVESAMDEAISASRLGCTAVIIRQDGPCETDSVTWLVSQIKERTGLAVALCMGERSYDAFAAWRQAGAEEYILPHQLGNPRLYSTIYPGQTPATRLTRFLWLRGLGYRVSGGLFVGLEGQTDEGLTDEFETLRTAEVASLCLKPCSPDADVLRLLAVARHCLPQADLWVANDDVALQSQALASGANVLITSMPGFQPDVESIPIAMAHSL